MSIFPLVAVGFCNELPRHVTAMRRPIHFQQSSEKDSPFRPVLPSFKVTFSCFCCVHIYTLTFTFTDLDPFLCFSCSLTFLKFFFHQISVLVVRDICVF